MGMLGWLRCSPLCVGGQARDCADDPPTPTGEGNFDSDAPGAELAPGFERWQALRAAWSADHRTDEEKAAAKARRKRRVEAEGLTVGLQTGAPFPQRVPLREAVRALVVLWDAGQD
eukprot:Hpha_TRINITY_DN3762_c0_g1::TRINITY_DN3762_c0_g1_i1::g.23849::m.23849